MLLNNFFLSHFSLDSFLFLILFRLMKCMFIKSNKSNRRKSKTKKTTQQTQFKRHALNKYDMYNELNFQKIFIGFSFAVDPCEFFISSQKRFALSVTK